MEQPRGWNILDVPFLFSRGSTELAEVRFGGSGGINPVL